MDDSVRRLHAGESTPADLSRITKLIAAKDQTLRALPPDALYELVRKLSTRVSFDVPKGHFDAGVWSFEPLADLLLRRFGVRDAARDAARNALYVSLRNRVEITRAEAVTIVEDEMARAGRVASMQPATDAFFVHRPVALITGITAITSRATRSVALHGMGGIGKTQLAAAMTHSSEVAAAFTDGILWGVLGYSGDAVPIINAMLTSLGLPAAQSESMAASARLRDALASRSCLVVIDDVWRRADVELFVPGSGDSCLLFTTRDLRLCSEIGAEVISVGPMERSESLNLVQSVIAQQAAFDTANATLFAERVGDLPLALRLGASQVREGMTFAELIEALEAADSKLVVLDGDLGECKTSDLELRRLQSLRACFDLSVRTLSPLVRATFLALAIVRDDTYFTKEEAALITGMSSPNNAACDLRVLVRKALVLTDSHGANEAWYLHDIIRDYVRDIAYEERSLSEMHTGFLDRCGDGLDRLWSDAPPLRYVDRNLIWHAEKAGRINVLHALVRESRNGQHLWRNRMRAQGLRTIFTETLDRSLFYASAEISASSSASVLPPIAAIVSAGIARSSLVSEAGKVAPPLAARLVAEGAWAMEDGLAHIELTSGLLTTWSLGWLQPYASPRDRQIIEDKLYVLISTAQVLEDTSLLAVAPYASAALRARLVAYGESTSGERHARILAHVAPYEPLLRDEWLFRFSSRDWKNLREKRNAYLLLLKVGLLPPSTTSADLLSMQAEPDTSTPAYLARIVTLLAEDVASLLVETIAEKADFILLEIVDEHPEGLPIELLGKLREVAVKVSSPLVAAWLLGVTTTILAVGDRSNALQQALGRLRTLPREEWRTALAIIAMSYQVSGEEGEILHIEAWNMAAEASLEQYGSAQFAKLCRPLGSKGVQHAAKMVASASGKVRQRCLPHLIRVAPLDQVKELVDSLIATTRELGSFADLLPCIDRIPLQQLEPLLAASVDLAPVRVSFEKGPNQEPAPKLSDHAWTQQGILERRIAEARVATSERMQGIEGAPIEDVRACIAEVLSNPNLSPREVYGATLESTAPALERCLEAVELRELESLANRMFALLSTG
ncbi:NB-ARC domain-containing protein [Dokdonella sp. MW10]|uniref:NB-ARC domain-containing protein n=1 Tax=Dokdonella sp. MW10 TaxID=2992926 RepID=UPI003F7E2C56